MTAAIVPSRVRTVFFDAVGTLIFPNPSALVIYSEVARGRGLTLTLHEIRSRFRSAYQAEEAADQRLGWVTSEARETARWQKIVSDTLAGVRDPETCFRELFEHFGRPSAWRVNPEAAAVFARLLERGVAIGIGSNYDSRLQSVLNGFSELAPLSSRAVISASVGFRKPSKHFFDELIRIADCGSSEIMFVGDDIENDYRGSTAAGLRGLLLDPQNQEPTIPDRILSLSELVTLRSIPY